MDRSDGKFEALVAAAAFARLRAGRRPGDPLDPFDPVGCLLAWPDALRAKREELLPGEDATAPSGPSRPH